MTQLDDYIKTRSKNNPEFLSDYNNELERLNVAVAIKQLRSSLHMSQREFAKHIGKPQSTVGRIETGKMNVSFDVLNEIAHATKTNLKIEFVKS